MTNEEDLVYILEKLTARHTKTVEFLAHLAKTKHWNVKELRTRREKNGFRMACHRNGKQMNIQESYEKRYDLSALTAGEQNILEAFSLLPYLPLSFEISSRWLLADAGAGCEDDLIDGLHQKGWLQFEEEQESILIHPVFAQFIFDRSRPIAKEHQGLLDGCKESMKIPEDGRAAECRKYLPFAESVIEKIEKDDQEYLAEYLSEAADLFEYTAEYKKAEELYEKALRIREEVLGTEHLDTAASYNNLGLLYYQQGEHETS